MLILPFIEQQNLANLYVDYNNPAGGSNYWAAVNLSVTGAQIGVMSCPSDQPTPQNETWNGTAYHNYTVNLGNTANGEAAQVYIVPTYNGVIWAGSPFVPGVPQRLVQITDGTSMTLMMAELIQSRAAGGSKDLRGLLWWGSGAGFQTYLRPNDTNPDVVWSDFSWCNPNPPNPPCTTYTGGTNWRTYAARSRHPGGVNVALCDGSARFVADTVDITTWRALGTAAGNEAVGDF